MATIIIVGVIVLSLAVTTTIAVLETNRSIQSQYQISVEGAAYSLAVGCELGLARGRFTRTRAFGTPFCAT